MQNLEVLSIGEEKSSDSMPLTEAKKSIFERPRTEEVRYFSSGEHVSRGDYPLYCEQL